MTAMMSMEIVRGETSFVVSELSPTEVERADAKIEGETSGWIGGFIFVIFIDLLYPRYSMDRESSSVGPNHQKTTLSYQLKYLDVFGSRQNPKKWFRKNVCLYVVVDVLTQGLA